MIRSCPSLALAMAMMASASLSLANEFEFEFSNDGYAGNAWCPDGHCGKHGRHHGHGHKHAHAHGVVFGSGYPNGRDNYGIINEYCAPGIGGTCKTCSAGDCQYRFYGQPDLFYNYYAWPSCSGVGAELYISPRPVPPHVGHVFITYQPLMPHEFLYQHHRTYHRYYNGGQGLNRTCVSWYRVPW